MANLLVPCCWRREWLLMRRDGSRGIETLADAIADVGANHGATDHAGIGTGQRSAGRAADQGTTEGANVFSALIGMQGCEQRQQCQQSDRREGSHAGSSFSYVPPMGPFKGTTASVVPPAYFSMQTITCVHLTSRRRDPVVGL